jgi:putative polyketide hydroxylase
MTMPTIDIPVLLVGGGPVGLCASILLSQHGVRTLLVERHAGTSIYPKTRLVNTRTMEVFRQCGLEQAVRERGLPADRARYAVWARTLREEELQRRLIATATAGLSDAIGPTSGCTISQGMLEPVLLAHARESMQGEIRFDHELIACSQDTSGVTATVFDRTSRETMQVRAQYLVGADGAHSRVREMLGVPMVGDSALAHRINILFRADLSRWVEGRSINICFIQHPDARGALAAIDGRERWSFQALYVPEAGQRAEDFTTERCIELIRAAVGVPDLPVEVLRVAPWSSSARVAARFRDGRMFLAGDAAHEMSPSGGHGMNTGMQDVHNLVWKLAAVLGRWAEPALLETYRQEREPVARWITEQAQHNIASLRYGSAGGTGVGTQSPHDGRLELFNELGMIFGTVYASTAVVSDGSLLPPVANPVSDYVPSAHPGCRAPHVWLEREGQRLSTLDLFGTEYVLLAAQAGNAWCHAAAEVAHARQVPLHAFSVGAQGDLIDPGGSWAATYGVEQDGAVLVRPDGHVAWRSRSGVSHPAQALQGCLSACLGQNARR